MVSHRECCGTALGADPTLALTPTLLRALQQPGGKLIQRAIPSTGERLPVIGLSFSNHVSCADPAAMKAVLKPLVQERKIGVMAFFPFGLNAGTSCGSGSRNLFVRVGTRPLPEWAAEFDAKTWAQFFLKYVISHPAVTVARAGTTKAHHMLDNMGGGIGRLPNEATRKRMAAFIHALPALPPLPQNPAPAQAPGIALSAAILERYVGEWKLGSGTVVTFRRDGTTLFVKPGPNPEAPLNARSETRFQDPRGPVLEFQVDAGGTVTGLILEQGNPVQRTPLTRVR